MLKFSKGHKKKKIRFFSEVNWVIFKVFFFVFFSPNFSSGNHFVQQSRNILAILIQGHKRNTDVKLF